MKRVLLTIEYDGSSYKGWQRQQDLPTIQGELEKALMVVCGKEVEVFASGRTDAGVHALGQSVHFDLNVPIPISRLADVLNSLLPGDIVIKNAKFVPDDFHARFDIKTKTYKYLVNLGKKDAFQAKYMAFYNNNLDLEKMQKASKMFLGKHDFKGYCSAQAITKDYHRTIYRFDVRKKKDILEFEVEGSGFLYNMVRILVGTLIDIGQGKLSEESAKKALNDGNRAFAGVTMPPNGLYLKTTQY